MKNRSLRILLSERECRHNERMQSINKRIKAERVLTNTQLEAQEKAVKAAFAASETAILKNDESQARINAAANEFRQSLNDVNKNQMSRTEVEGRLEGILKLLTAHQESVTERIERNAALVGELQKAMLLWQGQATGVKENRTQTNWATQLIVGAVIAIGSLVIGLFFKK